MKKRADRKSCRFTQTRHRPGALAVLALAAILLLSCRTLQSDLATPIEQIPPTPVITTSTRPFSTAIPTHPATAPPLPGLTASPAKEAACLPTRTGVQLNQVEFSGIPQAALDFLNQGGTPQDLDAALYQARFASLPVPVDAADMTGDGREEVVVAIYDPASSNFLPSGGLLIYECQAGRYHLGLQLDSPANFGVPSLRYLLDLNADGRAELVVSLPTCGASTCFEDVRIFAWDGQGFSNRLEDTTTDLPFPDIRLADPDGDRIFNLEVAGGAFGSVGAGPPRGLTRSWPYHPHTGTWRDPVDQLQSSEYRIHALQDAERAALEGDFDQALAGYQRVASDPGLTDWMDPPVEQGNLAAYALFKAAVVHLIEQQPGEAAAAFDAQARRFTPGQPGQAYVQLAKAFQEAQSTGGVARGCAAAQSYAADHPDQILAPLGPQTFGYANPDYSPQDICPW